jgi:hypothetical protein
VATVLTLALLFGAHAGLKGIPVPAFASGRAMIRELDALILERFAAAAPAETADPEEDTPEEAPPEETIETVDFEQNVATAVEELERRFGLDEEVPAAASRAEDGVAVATPGIADAGRDDRFESLFGAGAGADVAVGRAGRGRVPPARDGAAGLGIGINERVVEADPDPTSRARVGPETPGVTVATGAERAEATPTEVAVAAFEGEGFDGSEAARLATWMRAHSSPLPIGVRVHMNFDPTFLTAAVPVTSDGRKWDLFLMFNETLREIHIVLIDGDRSVYLIDRGFQEQSRSLREGVVRRSNGQIVAIDSRTGAASSERAQEFYNVFLSWWEQAKNDVRS